MRNFSIAACISAVVFAVALSAELYTMHSYNAQGARMNTKKFLLASLAVFVVYSALAYATHEVMLERDYRALGSSVRPLDEFTQRMPLLYLGNLVFALAVSYVYLQGY